MRKFVLLVLICGTLLCGCNNKEEIKVKKIDKAEVVTALDAGALLIDVRSNIEYVEKHIDKAINIDVNIILSKEDNIIYDGKEIEKTRKIIVYCHSGNRSAKAAQKLVEMGYKNVYDFGAMDNWGE